MSRGERVPIGCDALDELLGGGLDRATVTQVYGPPASGKTNLALTAAVEAVANDGQVVYIDTEGFSPDRFRQLLAARGVDPDAGATDRVSVRQVYDFEEQREAVDQAADLATDTDLVILDSATGFYRLERGEDTAEGDALRAVTRQVTHLLGLARKHDLAVLLTNQVFTDPEADRVRPLGGNTLAHWSGVIVRLERFRGGRRRAILEKHRSRSTGASVEFEITEQGLVGTSDIS